MERIFEYGDLSEREAIIQNNSDGYLVAERNIKDGNFLVFTTSKPVSVEIEELKERQKATDMAVLQLMMEGMM